MSTIVRSPILEWAYRDASESASRSGADIAEVTDLTTLRAVSGLFDRIWGRNGESSLVPFELLRAMSHGGNYVAAAHADGDLIGAAFGFRAEHEGESVLHSHVVGVVRSTRSRGVGFALKQHQRSWCLERGITTMTWTFDPLVRHNAYFNLSRLGAEVAAYLPRFYGEMDDALNGGESDRLLVRWNLQSERAASGARRDRLSPPRQLVENAAPLLSDDQGVPVLLDGDQRIVRCQVPPDIVDLRRSDVDAAAQWRLALREAMSPRLADGYQVAGMTRDGWYLMVRALAR